MKGSSQKEKDYFLNGKGGRNGILQAHNFNELLFFLSNMMLAADGNGIMKNRLKEGKMHNHNTLTIKKSEIKRLVESVIKEMTEYDYDNSDKDLENRASWGEYDSTKPKYDRYGDIKRLEALDSPNRYDWWSDSDSDQDNFLDNPHGMRATRQMDDYMRGREINPHAW